MKLSLATAAICLLTQAVYASANSASASYSSVNVDKRNLADFFKNMVFRDQISSAVASVSASVYSAQHPALYRRALASASASMASASVKASASAKPSAVKKQKRAASSIASDSMASASVKASASAKPSAPKKQKRADSLLGSESVSIKASVVSPHQPQSSVSTEELDKYEAEIELIESVEETVGLAKAQIADVFTEIKESIAPVEETVASTEVEEIEEQNPFWIDDEEAEVQFKGYDWNNYE